MQTLDERMSQLEQLCRRAGIPLTVQRRVVLETVVKRHDHPTAEQIYERVRERLPDISRTTVYRVLETLCRLGLVRRAHEMGAAARFDGNVRRHHHLICAQCNRIVDLEEDELGTVPLPGGRPHGFEVHDYSVHLTGTCAACRKRRSLQEKAMRKRER